METNLLTHILEKYPYFNSLTETTLFTTEEELEKMRKGEKIKAGKEEISIDFLKKICKDKKYYDYCYKYFKDIIKEFRVSYIVNGDTGSSLSYNKSSIIKGLKYLIDNNLITLTEEEQNKINKLNEIISFDKFNEKYNNKTYTVEVDNNNYIIPIKEIIDFMNISNEELINICNNQDIKTINTIPKTHFIYASIKFLRENKITKNYLVPNNIETNYYDILSLQRIDLESLNKHLETEDTLYEKIEISKDLKQEILKDMKNDYNPLEKAIYIYIKMCKLLTYDDEYFADNQKGKSALKHKDTNYINTITTNNNRIVCFEFNLIYSKLLNELGIHFKSDYKSFCGELYGEGHANLEFRYDKFIINADSVTSILYGDIKRAKLNEPLNGLTCINKNNKTKQEFNSMIEKIYKDIKREKSLDDLLSEYKELTDNIKSINYYERLSILIEKLEEENLGEIDILGYLLQLRKILFTEEQKTDNIKITIIRDKETLSEENKSTSTAIITINDISFIDKSDNNIYYYYNPNKGLKPISKEELQEKFKTHLYEYINNNDPQIPDIQIDGGKVK